jgi:hypothetical protein
MNKQTIKTNPLMTPIIISVIIFHPPVVDSCAWPSVAFAFLKRVSVALDFHQARRPFAPPPGIREDRDIYFDLYS